MKLKNKEDFFKLKEEAVKKHTQDKSIKLLIGFGTCGIAAGAKKIEEALEKGLSERNIKNAKIVRVGCVGYCYAEPTIEIVYPDGGSVILGNMKSENALDVIDMHILNKSFESQYVIPRNFE